jgi:hypothetical protein
VIKRARNFHCRSRPKSHNSIRRNEFAELLQPLLDRSQQKTAKIMSLVETVRTVDVPRQRMLCWLGELNGSAQARCLKNVEVFNEQGEAKQLKLFLSDIEVPDDHPQVRASSRFGLCFIRKESGKSVGARMRRSVVYGTTVRTRTQYYSIRPCPLSAAGV